MSNKTKIKILNMNLLIILIILILGAVFSVNIQAASNTSRNFVSSNGVNNSNADYNVNANNVKHTSSVPENELEALASKNVDGAYNFNNSEYEKYWWLLCCQYGEPLHTGTGDMIIITDNKGNTVYDGYAGTEDDKLNLEETNTDEGSYFSLEVGTHSAVDGKTGVEAIWYEYVIDQANIITNPTESYILATSEDRYNNDKATHHSATQVAWWNTKFNEGGSFPSNNLYNLAVDFQTYQESIMGVSLENPSTNSRYWAQYKVNGTTFWAPNIDKYIDPEFQDVDEIEVDYEEGTGTGTYIVGPFVMSGTEYHYKNSSESRQDVIDKLEDIYDDNTNNIKNDITDCFNKLGNEYSAYTDIMTRIENLDFNSNNGYTNKRVNAVYIIVNDFHEHYSSTRRQKW